ncbi:hypothetical protein IW140_005294 [Coemansia sp. RSA 1813]|nr:hypothetical protein EV178_005765 [Coemansia sp. RSA 1646]KAJ1768795.1 hypothetical protein LPJ74_004595 [Coemansia sp. RSA 1843]KAJ2086364.1 hypothetical protein IW138_005735 [Coemansia sp. RSA 986]KAJ2212289.1 hypothetical protein EV179_004759 [Coemansia sp. RSA 487]KAJ2565605.1 hypothetical protein IW140_005294 [Coemansia sp. RSA 1813]
MNRFIGSVKSQMFRLGGYDKTVSGMYIPRYYWFENTSPKKSWATFMSPEIIRSSFYQTLQEFPILAGHFKMGKDRQEYISVDRKKLNMPTYTDRNWDIDFKQIKDTGFNTNMLPETFHEASGFPIVSRFGTTGAKLGVFHVRRLKNFSGVVVFASIAHGAVDGHGYAAFMNRWAELSKLMHKNTTEKEVGLPTRTFSHDRSISRAYNPDDIDALDAFTLKAIANGSVITRFIAWLPADKRNLIFKATMPTEQLVCCSFHVPNRAIKALRESVQEYAPHGTRYSVNDVIAALMTMVIGQAMHKTSVENQNNFGNRNSDGDDTMTAVTVNTRLRLNDPSAKDFVGNLSFARYILNHQALVQADTNPRNISAIAANIREGVSVIDEKYIGQFNRLINSEPDMFVRVGTSYLNFKNRLVVSNVTKSGYYEADFGAGIPCLVRPTYRTIMNTIFIMLGHPDVGGYDLVMTLKKDVAKMVSQNEKWIGLVDSYNIDI